MNFDRSKNAGCIIPTIPPIDPRCEDSEFALANPTLCAARGAIIIKPSVLTLCVNDSIQFQAYEYKAGIETLLTADEISFSSSDLSVFSIGVRSGSGTCLSSGSAIIKATHTDGRFASANLEVGAADSCCDDASVAVSIIVDKSRSMTLGFGGGYATRLNFAKMAAKHFVGGMVAQSNSNLSASLSTIAKDPVEVVANTASLTTLLAPIAAISQSDQKTDLLDAFTLLTDTLLNVSAALRCVVLISDGEHTIDSNRQAVIDAASLFKAGGGVIIVVGTRASGAGFDLLQRIATGGYFVNAAGATAEESLAQVHYLASLTCAGACVPEGDTYEPAPELDYSAFLNFEVVSGQVNLIGLGMLDFLPGNDLYVELASGSLGTIRTVSPITIVAGQTYRINFSAAGNQREFVAGQGIKVFVRAVDAYASDPNIFEQVVYPAWDDDFQAYGLSFTPLSNASVRLNFEQLGTDAAPIGGNLLDFVKFENASTQTTILFDDFSTENLTYVPPRCGQSSALPEITNPEAGSNLILAEGSGDTSYEGYTYAVSYITQEGETAATEFFNDDVYRVKEDAVIQLTIPQPTDPRVTEIRIWRSLAYDVQFEVGAGRETFLWATIPVGQTSVLDSELNADFILRYDSGTLAPTTNTTAVAAGGLGTGLHCDIYDCSSSPPGVQASDPSPLPDIESGFNPPVTFTSTKTVCATCPTGTEVVTTENLIPVMTSNSAPSGAVISNDEVTGFEAYKAFDGSGYTYWVPNGGDTSGYIGYRFDSAQIITRFTVMAIVAPAVGLPRNFTFEGSNDGAAWSVLGTYSTQSWFASEVKSFPVSNTTAYTHYRVNISATTGIPTQNLNVAEIQMFGGGVASACSTATATSFVSQADADALANASALAAAQAQLTCIPFWEVTESAQAVCPAGTFGEVFNRSATRKSYVSLADAENQARIAAQALADAARDADCVGSNNTEYITIPQQGNASPYPSVKHVSGLTGVITKVTLTLNRFNHGDYGDVNIMLVSPEGTKLVVMSGAMNGAFDSTERNITFDDDAVSFIPQASRPAGVDHTFKPRAYETTTFPSPAPSNPSGALYDGVGPTYADVGMAAFNGEDPNGSWSLWIYDDLALSTGYIINGWDITITSA